MPGLCVVADRGCRLHVAVPSRERRTALFLDFLLFCTTLRGTEGTSLDLRRSKRLRGEQQQEGIKTGETGQGVKEGRRGGQGPKHRGDGATTEPGPQPGTSPQPTGRRAGRRAAGTGRAARNRREAVAPLCPQSRAAGSGGTGRAAAPARVASRGRRSLGRREMVGSAAFEKGFRPDRLEDEYVSA